MLQEHKALAKYIGFGIVAACAIALVALLWHFKNNDSAREWDNESIKATFNEFLVTSAEKVEAKWHFYLDNFLDEDYALPNDEESLFLVLTENGGMTKSPLFKLSGGSYIPAKKRVTIEIRMDFDYDEVYRPEDVSIDKETKKINLFLYRKLNDIEGFVIFDRAKRFEVFFPNEVKIPPSSFGGSEEKQVSKPNLSRDVKIDVGGVSIIIPVPEGYHALQNACAQTRKRAETLTPSINRLIEVFVSDHDFDLIMQGNSPLFDRHMSLQVFRKLENQRVSLHQFKELFSDPLKEEFGTLFQGMGENVSTLARRLTEQISKDIDKLVTFEFAEPIPLGCFMETPESISFAFYTKYQVHSEDRNLSYLIVGSVSYFLVNGRVLFGYVYSKYDTYEDLTWIHDTAENWIGKIVSENMTGRLSSQTPVVRGSYSSSLWERAIGRGLKGAMGGALIALIAALVCLVASAIRRRKSEANLDTHKK